MNLSEIINALENCEFFKELGEKGISEMAGLCRVETYQAGETVFHQGEFGENLYVVASGHVILERAADLGEKKARVVTAMLGTGQVLGCWSTLLGEAHNFMSSATCKKTSKLLVLKGSDLRDMMLENRGFGFRVLEKLCFLLRDRIQGAYGALEKI